VASIDTTASTLAEDALNKALARNAKDTAAHLILARLQLARAAFAPAIDHMEAAIALKPELADSALVAEMCRAYLADGLGLRGEAFFTAQLQAAPKANPLRLGKAILLGERGEITEAIPLAQGVADDPRATQEDANKARELIAAWKGGTP
jgi:lipopolysaccharide biosynthesis regulator YciM